MIVMYGANNPGETLSWNQKKVFGNLTIHSTQEYSVFVECIALFE